MSSYSFNSIVINGREVEIDNILNDSAEPKSTFEIAAFSFIQKWFSATEKFIQNTSGSTGTPKEIIITRQQMTASAKLTEEALDLKAGDSALLCLDPEYIAGKMMMVRSFITGMKIIAVNPSLNPFRNVSSTISLDFAALVPSQLYELMQSVEGDRLNTLKNIIVGGAELNKEVQKKLSRYSCQIYASYGMTETISHIALQPVNGSMASEYFTVLPGIKIASDERGCLEIEAQHLGKKIKTNDLVEIRDTSHFKWVGRADNIINSGGVKIIPEKIEAEIQKISESLKINNRFLISSLPDSRLGNKIILLVEGLIDHDLIEKIKLRLKMSLPPYEVPKEFYTNVDFIFTQSGKINRLATIRKLLIQHNSHIKNDLSA